MEMNDEIELEASRDAVWRALNDPGVLKECIPGCETLEKVSDTEFISQVVVKVGPIKAKFAGKVTLTDIVAPTSYRLVGEGQGGVAGFAKSDITVELLPQSPTVTLLRYGVTANIGGKIAQLGTRMIDSTARKMADQFFARFNDMVRAREAPAEPLPALVQVSAGATELAAGAPVGALEEVGNDILVTLVDVSDDPDALMQQPATVTSPGLAAKIARWLGRKPDADGATAARPAVAKPKAARHRAAVVTLNRAAQKNAVSLAMWRALGRIFTDLGRDPQVRVIILTGAGGTFSAGADIAEFAKVRASVEQGTEYEVAVDACCDAIAATPKPTIAVIDGFCMGGACHLAMSCDFRFAHPAAQFGIPAARLSIVYGVRGTQRLLALVGVANAKKVLYSAQKFDAAEAYRIGFADRVAPDTMRAAKAFAATMADNAPLTVAGTKVLLNGLSMGMGALDDATVREVIERAVGSEDYRDARQAFVEKRQPVFLGK